MNLPNKGETYSAFAVMKFGMPILTPILRGFILLATKVSLVKVFEIIVNERHRVMRTFICDAFKKKIQKKIQVNIKKA